MSSLLSGDELSRLTGGVLVNTDGASTICVAAPAATEKLVITDVVIANVHASTGGTVDIRDGVGGSVRATYPAPAAGGVVHALASPLVLSAGTAAAVDVSAAISTVTVTLRGYRAPA